MPFKSTAQIKACYASKGFGGKVDCDQWLKKTDFKDLPDRISKKKKPYKEKKEENYFIRTFSQDVNEEELCWHVDLEDRIVSPLKETDWRFKRDTHLPEKIEGEIYINANEWHSIINGSGDVEVRVIKIAEKNWLFLVSFISTWKLKNINFHTLHWFLEHEFGSKWHPEIRHVKIK